jgi:hypothetical protein
MFDSQSISLRIGVFSLILAGAAAGAARQRQERRQGATGQQQSDAANAYNQAYASCMTAKGFPGQ